MIDADNVDDIELLANTPAKAKSRQHGLKRAARIIDLQMNSDKTDFTYTRTHTYTHAHIHTFISPTAKSKYFKTNISINYFKFVNYVFYYFIHFCSTQDITSSGDLND